MPGAAAFGDLGVLRVGAAEHHKKSRMPRDRRPGGQRPGDRLRAAEDMRQKGQRGSEAVVARLVDKTARGGEKPPQSPARLVKMTGRRPALRAAHYRRGAVFAPHAPKLASDEFERSLPRDWRKRLAAAALAACPSVLQPARSYHRATDAKRRMNRIRDRFNQRRWVGIEVEWDGADHRAVLYDGVERAPMGVVWNKLAIHRALVDSATKPSTSDGVVTQIAQRRSFSVFARRTSLESDRMLFVMPGTDP